jgi:hypothetical protein
MEPWKVFTLPIAVLGRWRTHKSPDRISVPRMSEDWLRQHERQSVKSW